MNPYFANHLNNSSHLPSHLSYQAKQEAEKLSEFGINSEQDHKNYFYINLYFRKIAEIILQRKISIQEKENLSKIVFQNLNEYSINTQENFFKAVDHAISIYFRKKAYQMGENANQYPKPIYNYNKWFETYRKIAQGQNIDELTKSWDPVEKKDYIQWAKFYQEGNNLKYKTAQLMISDLKAQIPTPSHFDESVSNRESSEQEIQHQINSVLGRLNSAEKLVTSKFPFLRTILGRGYESWLSKLHELKRQIQTAPLKNAQSPLLVDLIYKHANQLNDPMSKNLMMRLAKFEECLLNFDKVLNKFAQITAAPLSPDDKGNAMEEFVLNLQGEDLPELKEKSKKDVQNIDDDEIEGDWEDENDDEIIVEAQVVADPQIAIPKQPIVPAKEDPDPNDLIERALSHVTVADVVNKLEALSNIFKNREIARQLNFIDMMLDKLGIAAFFPGLAEASRSALESNQYCQTRIEDVLAKIRGSMIIPSDDKIELNQIPEPTQINSQTPELNALKNRLTEDQKTNQAVKEKKKLDEQAKVLAPPPTETLQTAPELQQPVQNQAAQPNRVQ